MAIQSLPPLSAPHRSVSVLSISITQFFSKTVSLCVCFGVLLLPTEPFSHDISGKWLCLLGISCQSKGWEQTWLIAACFVLDWAACKHHAQLVWLHFSTCNYSLYLVPLQSTPLNKQLCALCFQYACIDLDSNFVPLCCRRHLESCLESGQATCSQFASH